MIHRTILPFIFITLLGSVAACRPACPIASCQVRKVHHHGKTDYRGQPIWKKQNPNIGERLPKTPTDSQARQRGKPKKSREK